MRNLRKGVVRGLVVVGLGGLALLTPAGAESQDLLEPDPCAHAYGPDLRGCWAREAERADEEMNQLYLALRDRLPKRALQSLEKAQELWLEFRDAHLQTLYGVESPTRTWGLDYPICLSISRVTLTRARTLQLRRLAEPDEQTLCPL